MNIPVPLARIAAFEELGFGLFLHWGLYSQLGQGEWVQNVKNYDWQEYARLIDTFTAADFDAEAIAAAADKAGIKYITLTARHHEGFSLYDTCGLNEFDAPHSPAGRDLIAEFVAACNKFGIKPFFYHTTIDWHWHGKRTDQLTNDEFREYLDYLYDSVEILCTRYGRIGGLWFDGNWARPDDDWQEDRLYGMIRKHQPDAVIVNNTGLFQLGKLGHPELDSVTFENNAAKPLDREGWDKYVAAEVCRTMNHHWGIGAKDFDFLSPRNVIEMLCHSRRCGANLLLNVGPTAQGGLPEYERAVLGIVGEWIKIYGESIYKPKPTDGIKCQNRDFLLKNGNTYYYFVHDLGISHGDPNVTVEIAGVGARAIDGFTGKVLKANWIDNGEEVDFVQDTDRKMLAVKCIGFDYGIQTCVRVMKIETC